MKLFLKLLMMSVAMFIVEPGEGGGADTGDGSVIEPPADGSNGGGATAGAIANQNPGDTGGGAPAAPDTVSVPRDQFERIASSVEQMENAAAISAAVSDISSRVPGFDLGKVHAYLQEMHETDPAGAKALNNPKGWEMLWKAEIADADVNADGVNHGRKHGGDSRRDLLGRVKNGEADAYERAGLLEKYL